ncbi:MAG: glutathione peroxidase [bacterium]|jgi:glutathione peroxidase|nr:glutathione peroxidase [bacterium]
MKILSLFSFILAHLSLAPLFGLAEEPKVPSIHELKVQDIDGKEVELKKYKGKVLLIVNVASQCGFTKQYADLVKLQDQYKDKDVVVMGFPANEFGGQEPGSNEEIKNFCSTKFEVEFPMFAKVVVKGKEIVPLFQYLTTAENPDFKGNIKWNFEKFLVGKDGKLLRRYRSTVNPVSEEITKAIDAALEKK